MPVQKIILHIDFDSYFASCEQQFNPKLRGMPIGVTAQNGRTCIIAASREAKKLGIKSPSRTFEALEKVPNMQFVSAHFEKYWEITQKFINICKDFSPYVELFSLDEVFMDITLTQNLFGGKYQLIDRIRQRIEDEIGEYITVSVGISYNKLLSKLASGMNKPCGLTEIIRDNLDETYRQVKLTDFCGIGERINLRLAKLGIFTPFDLRMVPMQKLKMEFGNVESLFLRNLSLGIDERSVVAYTENTPTKSVGRNYCLPKNEYDKRIIFQNLYELCEEVAIKLRRLGKSAKTIGIYLGGNLSFHGRKTNNEYLSSGNDIYALSRKILKDNGMNLSDSDYVRRMGIWASNLSDNDKLTLSLFDANKNVLNEVVDKINNKFGDHTIRNGFLLYADKLKTVPNGFMADRFERNKLAGTNI